MQIPLPRIPVSLVSRTAPALSWLCVLGLGAWLAAGWYWRLAGPAVSASFPIPLSEPGRASSEIAARHLFGQFGQNTGNTVQAPSFSAIVIGVMTKNGREPGFAVVQEDGKNNRAVIEGEEIAPGVKLVRVLAQGIEIDRNGRAETLPLESGRTLPAMPINAQTQYQPQNQGQSQYTPSQAQTNSIQKPQSDNNQAKVPNLDPEK